MAQKVAIVTGAAAGIGAACSLRLAKAGFAIGVLDLDEERCAQTVEQILHDGGQAVALGADVSNRETVAAAVQKCRSALGPVLALVNNAGVTDFTPFQSVTEELWLHVYKVNVLGTMIATQEVLADMIAAGWGRIVNISSSGAQTGAINMATYSSSKGAIVTLTRSLAQELGPMGITVNNIPPGSVMNTVRRQNIRHNSRRYAYYETRKDLARPKDPSATRFQRGLLERHLLDHLVDLLTDEHRLRRISGIDDAQPLRTIFARAHLLADQLEAMARSQKQFLR